MKPPPPTRPPSILVTQRGRHKGTGKAEEEVTGGSVEDGVVEVTDVEVAGDADPGMKTDRGRSAIAV